MRKVVGLITLDMKFASAFKEAATNAGLKVIHALSLDELPLSVKVVVVKNAKLKRDINSRKILNADDYGGIEEVVEKIVEAMVGIESYRSVMVAIDPGKTIGVAYLVNGKIIRTSRYMFPEKVVDDLRSFLERHSEADEKIIVVGSASAPEDRVSLLGALEKGLSGLQGLRIEVVDEAGTARGLIPREKGLSRDEYSAILLSLRKRLRLGRVGKGAGSQT